MIITPHILSIPPYISTTWKNISSIYSIQDGEKFKLSIVLAGRTRVIIPNLEQASVETILEAHARYGTTTNPATPGTATALGESLQNSISMPFSTNGVELLNSASQHNPEQANASDLPKEILEKITGIAKVLGFEDGTQFPKPEPHCNCPFCQIARAFHKEPNSTPSSEEELITDEDLRFRNWDIEQSAEQLYTVKNPLDQDEQYSVYLGEPLGCTCGEKNCEHIRAVLNS